MSNRRDRYVEIRNSTALFDDNKEPHLWFFAEVVEDPQDKTEGRDNVVVMAPLGSHLYDRVTSPDEEFRKSNFLVSPELISLERKLN